MTSCQGGQMTMGFCDYLYGLSEFRIAATNNTRANPNPQCINRNVVKAVLFKWPFQQTPSLVHVGLSMIDTQSHDRNVRIQVSAESITPYGFNLRFRSWGDSLTQNAAVSWFVCP
ncbi:unnamed protein product [Rotaria sordida]|uniref:H-type lectin domain-containing protein n=1 Tax=Rotaria sordida TaxID=392033 RepID=A0A815H9M4_9BILA|nr:unnamed protein product [Rotaria sordida]CAF1600824.1 unnamed protein product [Rotaria sordida]